MPVLLLVLGRASLWVLAGGKTWRQLLAGRASRDLLERRGLVFEVAPDSRGEPGSVCAHASLENPGARETAA